MPLRSLHSGRGDSPSSSTSSASAAGRKPDAKSRIAPLEAFSQAASDVATEQQFYCAAASLSWDAEGPADRVGAVGWSESSGGVGLGLHATR